MIVKFITTWLRHDAYTRRIAGALSTRFDFPPDLAHGQVLEFDRWLSGDTVTDADRLEDEYDCREIDLWPADKVIRASRLVETLRVL